VDGCPRRLASTGVWTQGHAEKGNTISHPLSMRHVAVVGLDIGTSSVKMMAGHPSDDGSGFEILGFVEEPSLGVRRGVVMNPDETTRSVVAAKNRLESVISRRINEVIVSIGGSHLFLASSRGVVAVSRADGQISQEDVDRVLQAAQALSLETNKEMLDVFPREFVVDGVAGVKEVVGMRGVRLESEVLAVCGFSPYIKNLTSAVLTAGLEIENIIPTPLAAATSSLTPQQKELGVAVLDLGAGTTGLAVFQEGDLLHSAIFPVGSENITNDIAIGLRTEPEVAEQIKKEFGTGLPSRGRKTEKVEVPGEEPVTFTQRFLSHIIEARTKEIMQQVQKELKKIAKQGDLPAGVVICGGGAKLPKIVELAKKELKLPVKIGTPQSVVSTQDDPALMTVLGLIVQESEEYEERERARSSGLLESVKKVLRVFIP